jgi:hypothetical protein
MMKRRASKAMIGGLALAAVHLIAICALASIVVRHQHSENVRPSTGVTLASSICR